MSTHLVIRVDSNNHIGVGHLMRCLALAQYWRDHIGVVTFLVSDLPEKFRNQLKNNKCEVIPLTSKSGTNSDARELIKYARQQEADWIVIDGYHFEQNYQKLILESGFNSLVFDDTSHLERYSATLLLNQNIHAKKTDYERKFRGEKLLLGNQFSLLRKEFLLSPVNKKEIPERARNIFITFGLGGHNRGEKIKTYLEHTFRENIEIRSTLNMLTMDSSEPNISALMKWADICVSAGGSTLWELAYLKVPSLIIPIADNQVQSVLRLAELNKIAYIGYYSELDFDELDRTVEEMIQNQTLRESLSENISKLVDGKGVERVVHEMTKFGVLG
jgi:UDP-2,4-diacetamido-2,4,6-trideoxy-beta-L-altropyranose hydrolase